MAVGDELMAWTNEDLNESITAVAWGNIYYIETAVFVTHIVQCIC